VAIYILRRTLWLIPVLLFISLVTFVLMHAVEGGPWDSERRLPPSVVQNLNRKYGLDKPVWPLSRAADEGFPLRLTLDSQYTSFLGNALRGDLGVSFQRQDRSVTEIILSGFRITAAVGLIAATIAAVCGITLGVLAAIHRNGFVDYASVLLASVGAAVPSFVLGIFLIYVLSVQLHLLPTFGWDTRNGLIPGVLPRWQQMVMPILTLAALPMALLARMTRASMLEVLTTDYVRTARAKGLPESVVMRRHALRTALIPVLTVIGPITASLLSGSFIVEQLFSIPGVGRLFVQSIEGRDYGVIMGTTLFYAVIIAVANLVVDISYAYVDPRIRLR
jgi:oligopeptide transport system permease protein